MTQTTTQPWYSPGRIGRFIGFLFTAGFAFPNVLVEDLDLSAMQTKQQGTLYDK